MADVFEADRLTACPYHDNDTIERIDFCPLHIESHIMRLGEKRHLGCVIDVAADCMVRQGKMDFGQRLARIRSIDPRLVSNCEFRVTAEIVRDQQRRNMRSNGIQ